jgi:hypothetical protein
MQYLVTSTVCDSYNLFYEIIICLFVGCNIRRGVKSLGVYMKETGFTVPTKKDMEVTVSGAPVPHRVRISAVVPLSSLVPALPGDTLSNFSGSGKVGRGAKSINLSSQFMSTLFLIGDRVVNTSNSGFELFY